MRFVSLPHRAMKVARIDWSRRRPQPSVVTLAIAVVLSVAGSLTADALIVLVGTSVFPSTRGYAHFRFPDYATLTIIGVPIACAAWPIVARVSSVPRWLFFRLAVMVTLVLWLPDVDLLIRHQPVRAVAVLVAMHLAIAIVTYNILVRVASVRVASVLVPGSVGIPRRQAEPAQVPIEELVTEPDGGRERSTSRLAAALAVLVGVEFVVGIVVMVFLPAGRPSRWLPTEAATLYLAHAILGLPLTLGAVALLIRVRGSTRTYRLSGWIGCVGVAIAGAGGLLTVAHSLRLVGMAFMLVGPVIAGFGYLIPTLDTLPGGTPPVGAG